MNTPYTRPDANVYASRAISRISVTDLTVMLRESTQTPTYRHKRTSDVTRNNVRQGRVYPPYWIQQRALGSTWESRSVSRLQVVTIVIGAALTAARNLRSRPFVSRCSVGCAASKNTDRGFHRLLPLLPFSPKLSHSRRSLRAVYEMIQYSENIILT